MLLALAICCTLPMIGIIVLVAVFGVAIGWAAAVAFGLIAAGICIAVMVQNHRGHSDHAPHS